MNLFQLGDFTLSSGIKSIYKIDCDALTDDDWQCIAFMARTIAGSFSEVVGVPRGGLKLAGLLEPYCNRCPCSYPHQPHDYCNGSVGPHPLLLVDDVLTTGGSMERLRKEKLAKNHNGVIGVVAFARGPCASSWIRAVCQLPEALWLPGYRDDF